MNKKIMEKMSGKAVDLGDMPSRDLGNLMSKSLVEYGKELAAQASPNGYVDYGSLPSKALPNLGKIAVQDGIANGISTSAENKSGQ